tara:strand:+ start:1333 stop:1716 length:384 start_codon:yes stop_codon:yes gene_type:complete
MSSGYPSSFKPEEFVCKCGKECASPDPSATRHLAWVLQQVRDFVGVPIRINSGYRCPDHNAAIGGHPNSYHLKGWAADLDPIGISASELHETIEHLAASQRIPSGGMGLYKTFVHYDIQPTPRRWQG